MKKITNLRWLIMSLLLAVGTGCVWGQETKTATLQLSSVLTSPVTQNDVTFTWTSSNIITGEGNGSGFKNSSNMTVTLPQGASLTKIDKVNGNNWGSNARIRVYAGTNAEATEIASIVQGTNSYSISNNNTGGVFYFANTSGKNAWIKSLTITYTTGSATPISGYNIDFESPLSAYTNWTFENIGTTNTAISAHNGSKYGANINDSGNGVATASIKTKNKVDRPGTFTCYVSKVSTNTSSSTWTVQVSSDGETWTDVKTQDAVSMSKGEWTTITTDLSSYTNVYIRLYYSGSTAIRAVDDISLTEAVAKTLESISVTGTPASFFVGDDFSTDGIVVTATYTDGTTQDVTNAATYTGYDMSTTGTQTVTVTYTIGDVTKTATYSIVVNPQPTYTVTLADDNTTLTESSYQAGVTLPSRSAVGYTFLGWTFADIPTETTTAPETIIPAGTYQPTQDITLHPVYRRVDGEGSSSTTSNVTISDYAADNNWSNGTQYPTIEIDENITATASGGGNDGKYYSSGSNWRFYQNSSGKLTISASEGNTLQSVKITYTIDNTGTFLYGGDTYISGTELSVTGLSVTFTVGNTGEATNGQTRVTAISVTYASGGSSTTYYTSHPVQTPSISFAEATAEVNIGANYTQPATPSNVEGLTYSIAYTSDNECATVNNNGVVTGVSEGTAIITATMTIGSDTYTATYTITVNDPNKPGSVNNPYTVAQALDIIDPLADNGKTDWVYVTGTISSITEVSTHYGNATYLIKDDEDNTLTIYRGKYLNNNNFTSGSQIAVGDVVVVYGQLQKYVKNGETTPEVAQGNYLVSLLHYGTDVPAPIFDPVDGSSFSEPYTVTISAEAGLTIYYISQDNKIFKTAAGGRTPNYAESNGELVSAAVAYSGALTFGQSMMVTAICMDANGNFSDPVTVKYTYTGSVVPPYYSSFSASEGDFTGSQETDDNTISDNGAPEWKMNSNTGADAIARWGEERYYMYVRGTSENTCKFDDGKQYRTRWYGTAYFTSPIIDLTDKANASFSFIHAAHHFYADPNTSATTKNANLETTLDDSKIASACQVQVGVCDENGNVSSWTTIPTSSINYPEQLFDPSKSGVSADGKSTTSTTSRSGLFPRANSGDISLSAYEDQKIRIRFAYTSTPQNYGTWNIDQITVNAIDVEEMKMNSRGWTTYVFDHDIDAYQTTLNYISDDEETLQIYKVTEFDKETCVLQQLGKFEEYSTSNNSERYIPAKTPVVIHGPAGATIDFVEYSAPEMLPTVKNNLLIASLAPNTAKAPVGSGIRYFVLQWINGAPCFNKVKENREIPDHKAYLNGTDQVDSVNTTESIKERGIYVIGGEEEGTATAIDDVVKVEGVKDNVFYNLAGQRVMNPTKGIYIVNGKKVFIK